MALKEKQKSHLLMNKHNFLFFVFLIPFFAFPQENNEKTNANDQFDDDIDFNPIFLNSKYANSINLKQFSKPNSIPEGEYQVDVYVNGLYVINDRVNFKASSDGVVSACLNAGFLDKVGVGNFEIKNKSDSDCIDTLSVMHKSILKFDLENQRLDISVPQMYLKKTPRGDVSPEDWDSGVAAAFVAYNANVYTSNSHGNNYQSQYVGVNSGINLGEWFFRHNGSFTHQSNSESNYQTNNTYVQHDITPFKARLILGQSNTSGRLFDTLPFTGTSLSSDDQMLPLSRRGYAPEVRGIATSNARVTIRQGERVIYETTVSPGAFVINDLYPNGFGGDLHVTVRESNGVEKSFTVPFSSVPDLLRPGEHKFEFVAGKYRNEYDGLNGKPLLQAIWQQGISNVVSLYSGIQVGDNYTDLQVGGAVDTSYGAISVDATHSATSAGHDSLQGESYRISYNKLIQETGSNISLAAYRFSTKGYQDYATAMQYLDLYKNKEWLGNIYHEKERFVVSIQQLLGEKRGTIYLSNLWRQSWNTGGWQQQYSFGYSNSWGNVNYSISLNRAKFNKTNDFENTWMLSLGFPLGTVSQTTVSTGITRNSDGNFQEQASISGTEGEENQFSWGVGGTHDSYTGNSGNISSQYRTNITNLGLSIGLDKNSKSLASNVSGAIIAHPKGITLTPFLADSYVVISAPGAEGASLPQYSNIKLDHWGNAAIPVWSPYNQNEVQLDPKGLPSYVELDETREITVPRAGAITSVNFITKYGFPLLLTPKGSVILPFGSNVTDEHGKSYGIVSQGGDIYVRVPIEKGQLFATWSDKNKNHTCIIPYLIKKNEMGDFIIKKQYQCNE